VVLAPVRVLVWGRALVTVPAENTRR
jgi:hypothetical protein